MTKRITATKVAKEKRLWRLPIICMEDQKSIMMGKL